MEESRKQFEDAWVSENSGTEEEAQRVRDALKRIWITNESGNGAYFDSFVMMAFKWWGLSRAAVEIELPPVCDAHSDDTDKGYDICHYRTQEYLNKQGFKFSIEGADRWAGLRVKEK